VSSLEYARAPSFCYALHDFRALRLVAQIRSRCSPFHSPCFLLGVFAVFVCPVSGTRTAQILSNRAFFFLFFPASPLCVKAVFRQGFFFPRFCLDSFCLIEAFLQTSTPYAYRAASILSTPVVKDDQWTASVHGCQP